MNANTDIGWNCEEVVCQILKTVPTLAALKPVHADDDTDSTQNRIVIESLHVVPEAPNGINPAKNVRKVELTATVRAALGQSNAPDLYSAYGTLCQTLESISSDYSTLPAVAQFAYLQPTLELENEREREENKRRMVKRISFVAILLNPS